MSGKLILVIGPSGSGKSTLIEYTRAIYSDLVSPVSCTTRAMRPGEKDGQVYYFVSRTEFERRIKAGHFLEWAEYGGNLYGTLKDEILTALDNDKNVLREVEVQGARQIKKILPKEHLRIIFVDAGSWEDLERRITFRAQISTDELSQRKARTEDEISFKGEADVIINNTDGNLEEAKKDIVSVIEEFIG
jgi:guanylate kinase